MSLEERKIKTYADNVKDLSDYPSDDGITADELKAIFDGRGDKELKSAINGIIEELISQTGAGQIGSIGGNVQRELDQKAENENPRILGSLDLIRESEHGEGILKITPATYGEEAILKISDPTGICAAITMDFDGNLKLTYGNEYIEEQEKTGSVYTTLSHPKLDLIAPEEQLTDAEKSTIRENIGLSQVDNTSDADKPISKAVRDALVAKANAEKPYITGAINFDDAEMVNRGDAIIISRPMQDTVPASSLTIGYDLMFEHGGIEYGVYHSGNLKNLAESNNTLDAPERNAFMENTGLDLVLGDIETALDAILALQASYMGGESL